MRRFSSPIRFAIGLFLVGFAGYYLLGVAGRNLSAEEAAAVASLYLLVNIIGPGISTALEQETNRRVSHALAHGDDPGPAIRRMIGLGAKVVAGAALVLLALSPLLVGKPLKGSWGLFGALLLAVVTFAAMYLVRGVLGGYRRFTGYTVTLAMEGLTRLVPFFVLDALGVANAVLYGFIFTGGCAFAALSGFPWLRKGSPSPGDPIAEGGTSAPAAGNALGQLLTAALLTQAMANLAPVVVTSRLSDQAALTAAFSAAFVLARVPLFLFAPVQAVLLPRLVTSVANADLAGVRHQVRNVLLAVAGIGIPGAIGAGLLGPWVLRTFFGARVELSWVLFAVLGLSTTVMMAVQVIQPALLATHRHRALMTSWITGTVVLLAVLFLPGSAVTLAVVAQLAGPAVVLVLAATALARSLRAADRQPPEPAPEAGGTSSAIR